MMLTILAIVVQYMYTLEAFAHSIKPNIIFILIDDAGWADFNYNIHGQSSIPTPNIDRLAAQGIKLKAHYAQPSCTPSRASLMTGRYATNTALNFALFPGGVSGLPDDMPTMPQLLRKAGYNAHMVGKWHLGNAQWKQTPVGKGFESYFGSLLWDADSYKKTVWTSPLTFEGIDQIKAFENGTYHHTVNSKHLTQVLTHEAIRLIETQPKKKPLFLYLSYNAPHSPLQPDPESASKCKHIPHLWRRQFCGLMVGLDTGIGQIYETTQDKLGSNTVIVVSSDNGGASWFGAVNAPLRSGKMSAFEGGVRVPAFIVDLNGRYIGKRGKVFLHKIHISDWLPTFLSWASASGVGGDLDLDGVDQSKALLSGEEARAEILLDLCTPEYTFSGDTSIAYIKGKYKLIYGNIKDNHIYSEPNSDQVKSSDDALFPKTFIEKMIRLFDIILGETLAESIRGYMSFILLPAYYASRNGVQLLLFDLENDISEANNIADHHPDITKDILEKVETIKQKRPKARKYWMISKKAIETDITVLGLCPDMVNDDPQCRFVHWWLPDDADLDSIDKVDGLVHMKWNLMKFFLIFLTVVMFYVISVILFYFLLFQF